MRRLRSILAVTLASCASSSPPLDTPRASSSSAAAAASASSAGVSAPRASAAGAGAASAEEPPGDPTPEQLTCVDGRLPAYPSNPPGAFVGTGNRVGYVAPRTTLAGVPSTTGARGRAIAEGACALSTIVENCYHDALARSSELEGTLGIALTIDAGGKVSAAKKRAGSLTDAPLVACVEQAFRAASFSPTAAGTSEYTMTFTRPPRPARVREAAFEAKGALPPEVIRRIVRSVWPGLRACYDQALKVDRAATGTVNVTFEIDPKGALASVTERNGTLRDATARSCVVKVLSGLAFPEPERGRVTVSYSLEFLPAD